MWEQTLLILSSSLPSLRHLISSVFWRRFVWQVEEKIVRLGDGGGRFLKVEVQKVLRMESTFSTAIFYHN